MTEQALRQGLGAIIIAGLPEPKTDPEKATGSLRPEDVVIEEMDPEIAGIIIAPAPRQPKKRDSSTDCEAT